MADPTIAGGSGGTSGCTGGTGTARGGSVSGSRGSTSPADLSSGSVAAEACHVNGGSTSPSASGGTSVESSASSSSSRHGSWRCCCQPDVGGSRSSSSSSSDSSSSVSGGAASVVGVTKGGAHKKPGSGGGGGRCGWGVLMRAVLALSLACAAITMGTLHTLLSVRLDMKAGRLRVRRVAAGPTSWPTTVVRAWARAVEEDGDGFDQPVISVCHPTWAGIRSATYARGAPVLEVEDLAATAADMNALVDRLRALPALRLLVVDGIVPGSIAFAYALAAAAPGVRMAFVYHGASSNAAHVGDSGALEAVLRGVDDGVVAGLAFVKAGMAPSFASLGVPAFTLPTTPAQPAGGGPGKPGLVDGAVHVGVLGGGAPPRVVLVQLMAACPLEGLVVHVLVHDAPAMPFLHRCRARFVTHAAGRHEQALAGMDVNMYMSSSESYPAPVMASLAAGVPCLVSPTTLAYDADDILQQHLVVHEYDNPAALRESLVRAIKARAHLAVLSKGLAQWLYVKARHEWSEFTAAVIGTTAADASAPSHTPPPYHPRQYSLSSPPQPPAVPAGMHLRIGYVAPDLADGRAPAAAVIRALVGELLARGHTAVLLSYTASEVLQEWCASLAALAVNGTRALHCHHIPTLLAARGDNVPSFDADSEVAAAVREAYRATPFDVLELVDTAGAAYDLLAARATATSTGSSGKHRYLPDAVRIVVRLHGTMELGAGDGVLDTIDAATQRAYWREVACLEGADWLLAPSDAVRALYAYAYNLNPARLLIAPPPTARLLAPVLTAMRDPPSNITTTAAARANASAVSLTARVDRVTASCKAAGCRVVLVLADGARPLTVALAALWALAPAAPAPAVGDPPASRVHFVFVGAASPCAAPAAKAAQRCSPHEASVTKHHATFLPPLDRTHYRWLVAATTPVAAIVTADGGGFNLAARDMLALHVPVIVPAIVATADLPPAVTVRYTPGDAASLAAAVATATRQWADADADADASADGITGSTSQTGTSRDSLSAYAAVMRLTPAAPAPAPMLAAALAAL